MPLTKNFLSLALPNILANLAIPLAGVVDIALLGHLHSIAPLAGVALATIIFDFIYWGFGFLRMGTTGLTAHAFGKEDRVECSAIFIRSLIIALSIGVFIWLFQSLIAHFGFALLQGTESVEQYGQDYFDIRIWAAPTTLLLYVINGWLLGMHRSGRVLILALTLNGLNIVLDWYFIYHLNFEAMGAGLATLIASILSCCLGLFFVIQLTPTIQLPTVTQLLDSAKLKSLFSLNFNLLIRTLFLITVFALFTNISSLLGVLVLAANTISLKIIATGAYFIDGFAFSLEAIAGKSFGAQNSTILRSSLYLALTYTFLTVTLFSIGIYFFAPELYGVFASAAHHPSVITLGASHRLFVIATLFCAGAAYIFDGFFIGMARGDILRRSMVFSTVLGFIPGAVLALVYSNVAFLWSALICFMLLRSITLGVHIKRVMRCVFDQSTVQDAP